MREIKFRAWGTDRKDMPAQMINNICVASMDYPYPMTISGEGILIRPDNTSFVLMQYTGLKDKNGKEIYEGDIVKMPDAEQAMWVEYQPPEFVMRFKTKSGNKSESWSTFDLEYTENQLVEIIGNIYENPELLK